jgi:glycosyltransferase involved in cell wall biosynthesis
MIVSIIIPTYNGANKILNLLQALELQSFTSFEVIIVIDGSKDNTKEILARYKSKLFSIKVIEQENQGRAKVRNNGAKVASGDLLIFFDDDMRPLNDCVLKHVQHHNKWFDSILTGGVYEDRLKCKTDIQLYKAYLSKKWSLPLLNYREKPLPKENIFITAANFSCSKKTFFELSGFDEDLNDAEDYDLAIRAFKNNISLFYSHQARAWHDDFITCASYVKRLRQYKHFNEYLFLKKPDLYSEYGLRKTIMPSGIKKVIFIFFAKQYWIYMIDKFNWLIVFPKILRYRLYDLIITANGVYYSDRVKL